MKKIVLSVVTFLIIIIIMTLIYFNDYYHADDISNSFLISDENVKVLKIDDGYFFDGIGEDKALIFYPGAKVETKAYARLMRKFAENGIDCFLIDMPFRFAFFGIKKANNILSQYNYEEWMLGGHSLRRSGCRLLYK